MKILIHAHRIIAIDRWRFFAQRMMELGHDVRGITSNLHDHRPFLEAGFKDVGIKHIYQPEQIDEAIDSFLPDFVCGEMFSPDEVTGRAMIERTSQKGIPSLIPQHQVNSRAGIYLNHGSWSHAHLFCATIENSKLCGTGRLPWPQDKIHAFGNWEHDELFDVKAPSAIRDTHELLNVGNRKVIAVFPNGDNTSCWIRWVGINKDWLIVAHPHPMFRKTISSKDRQGFLNRGDANYRNFHEAYDKGAIFCVDHLPGNLDGIELKQIHRHALILAANVILSASPDVCWDAYVLGKRSYLLGTNPELRKVHPSFSPVIDTSSFFHENTDFVSTINKALSEPSGLVQDWKMLEDRYGYVDGRWWERTYNLAKELINDSPVRASEDGI